MLPFIAQGFVAPADNRFVTLKYKSGDDSGRRHQESKSSLVEYQLIRLEFLWRKGFQPLSISHVNCSPHCKGIASTRYRSTASFHGVIAELAMRPSRAPAAPAQA